MSESRREAFLETALGELDQQVRPLVDMGRPYVAGLEGLPPDGRFLLVGNHTAFGSAEVLLVPHFVRRATGLRVRTLADRGFARMRGPGAAVVAAYGGVVGTPESARELMRHNETVLVFPGGGHEMPKFKGEEYTLRWRSRAGFARLSVESGYPIVPVGLVGGDDVYLSLVTRDGPWGRISRAVVGALSGEPDLAMPIVRGIGPTLIPRPQRMYLGFGRSISTVRPSGVTAGDWVEAVRNAAKHALEQILHDLQDIRAQDPFRQLNPLHWSNAARPATAQ